MTASLTLRAKTIRAHQTETAALRAADLRERAALAARARRSQRTAGRYEDLRAHSKEPLGAGLARGTEARRSGRAALGLRGGADPFLAGRAVGAAARAADLRGGATHPVEASLAVRAAARRAAGSDRGDAGSAGAELAVRACPGRLGRAARRRRAARARAELQAIGETGLRAGLAAAARARRDRARHAIRSRSIVAATPGRRGHCSRRRKRPIRMLSLRNKKLTQAQFRLGELESGTSDA